MGARIAPADHRRQLLLRIAALHRHRRRDGLPVPEVDATTTRSGATRSRIATGLALIGFALFPLMPPRLLDPHTYAFVHHDYGFVDTLAKDPAFWSFNSGAVSKISNQFAAMPSVHCAWALWCACALVPAAEARVGEGARGRVPGHHGDRDRGHRQPLLPRRGRRASSSSASATSPRARFTRGAGRRSRRHRAADGQSSERRRPVPALSKPDREPDRAPRSRSRGSAASSTVSNTKSTPHLVDVEDREDHQDHDAARR